MPNYWEGSTLVGSSGGEDTKGKPIEPQGIVGGVDYGLGVTPGDKGSSAEHIKFGYNTITGIRVGDELNPKYQRFGYDTRIGIPTETIMRREEQIKRTQQNAIADKQNQHQKDIYSKYRDTSGNVPVIRTGMRPGFESDNPFGDYFSQNGDYDYSRPLVLNPHPTTAKLDPKYGVVLSSERYEAQRPKTVFEKAGAKLEEEDTKIAQKLHLEERVRPVLNAYEKTRGLEKKVPIFNIPENNLGRVLADIGEGFVEGVSKKPVTTAANAAIAVFITKGIGYAPKISGITEGIGAGKVLKHVSAVNVVGTGMAIGYGAEATNRVLSSDRPKQEIGKILGTEVVPMVVGGFVGTQAIPKSPYTISTKKPQGILFELKDIYSSPAESSVGNNIVTTGTRNIAPEDTAVFATTPKGGFSDIYFRPPKDIAQKWMDKITGKIEYVNTKYGSYLNIKPVGMKPELPPTKQLAEREPIFIDKAHKFIYEKVYEKDADTIKKILTPVFEKMGVNIAELGSNSLKIEFKPDSYWEGKTAVAQYDTNENIIYLRNGRRGFDIVSDIAHEFGHAATKFGGSKFGESLDKFPIIDTALGEISAFSFEARFNKTFSQMYKTDISDAPPLKYVKNRIKSSYRAERAAISDGSSSKQAINRFIGRVVYAGSAYVGSRNPQISTVLKDTFKLKKYTPSTGTKVKHALSSAQEQINKFIRVERRLDIHKAEINMVERETGNNARLQEINWDFDIGKDTPKRGSGIWDAKPYGGEVAAAQTNKALQGTIFGSQRVLTVSETKPLFTHPKTSTKFISLFDDKMNELENQRKTESSSEKAIEMFAGDIKNIYRNADKITTIHQRGKPITQKQTQTRKKRIVIVQDTSIADDLQKLFYGQPPPNTRGKKNPEPTPVPPPNTYPDLKSGGGSSNKKHNNRKTIFDLFDDLTPTPNNKRRPSPNPDRMIYPTPNNNPAPNPKENPSPSPNNNPAPNPKENPSPQKHPAPQKTPTPGRNPNKEDIINRKKIPKLESIKRIDIFSNPKYKKKRKSKAWRVKNPIPAAEEMIRKFL